MRILYDDTIFVEHKYGGVARYFTEIITRIKGYNGIGVSVFKCLKGKLARLNNLLLDYRMKKNKFDIYHPTYYSKIVKKRRGIKTVVTVYDMIHELHLADSMQGVETKRKSILNADYIICISNNTKNDLQKIYGIPDKLISVVYLGAPVVGEFSKKEDNIHSRPYILYVGRRRHYKNFITLVRAFCQLELRKYFDLVCFGGGGFSKEELAEFKKMNLHDAVQYMEGPDELLQYYYENSIALVYPSLYEGFGLPVLEAMSFGCPVIVSNVASVAEIAGDAALFFSPEDVEELSRCLKDIINDKQLRDSYIEKGRLRAKVFSWDKTALETFNIYQKIMN